MPLSTSSVPDPDRLNVYNPGQPEGESKYYIQYH